MKIGDNSPILAVLHNSDGTTGIILNREYPRTKETVPFLIVDTHRISLCLDAELAAELAVRLAATTPLRLRRIVDPRCHCGGELGSQPEGSPTYSCGHALRYKAVAP